MRDFGSKIIRKPGTAAQAGVAEKKPKRVEEGFGTQSGKVYQLAALAG